MWGPGMRYPSINLLTIIKLEMCGLRDSCVPVGVKKAVVEAGYACKNSQ